MKECVTTARLFVLVNGSPTKEFSPQRGLRQGDPLSPFLFNIVAEGLSALLLRTHTQDLIKGSKIGSNDVALTPLQFVDDSILFCESNMMVVSNLNRILRCFEVLSSLKINYHKTVVCGVGVAEDSFNDFA